MAFVNKLAPNDVIVVDGPAIIHLNVERGQIIAATSAPDATAIVPIRGRDYGAIRREMAGDVDRIIAHVAALRRAAAAEAATDVEIPADQLPQRD